MSWNFDNSYYEQLEGFYAAWHLTPPAGAQLLAFNQDLSDQLGLPLGDCSADELAAIFGGAKLPQGAQPIAFAYAGHQFGQFNPQLGDGRALLLGEVIAPDGQRHDIQLKGSGPTPFSRNGDGRCALGPALREYLMSEAMHALDVPTTRALSVVATGERVQRETGLPGAIITRTAASHIRIGTMQFFAAHYGADHVRKLADYTIARHYPLAAQAPNPYLALLEKVMAAQIKLVAKWVNLGFVHGVMNTDNVALSGETIDYGPCAFLDSYSEKQVFSSIDRGGRYAFGNQPSICHWNMLQFANSLAEIISENDADGVEKANFLLRQFPKLYFAEWLSGMRAKLGLIGAQEGDLELAKSLFTVMEGQNVDFTLFFRKLAEVPAQGVAELAALFNDPTAIAPWLEQWRIRIAQDGALPSQRREAMNGVNPLYIPRNHMVEEALAAAHEDDLTPFQTLLEVVTNPFEEHEGWEKYAQPAPDDAARHVTFCGT